MQVGVLVMTLDEYRALAAIVISVDKSSLPARTIDRPRRSEVDLAYLVMAVFDVIDELGKDRGPLGNSHVGPMLAESLRDAVANKLKESR